MHQIFHPREGLGGPGGGDMSGVCSSIAINDFPGAVLLITHDVAVVRALAHELLVMQHGRAVEELSREALAGAQMKTAYARSLFEASADRMLG